MHSPDFHLDSLTVKALAVRLRSGDEEAFTQLYYIYKDKIFAFALRFIGSAELGKEVVQEVFVRLWDVHETIDPDKSLNAYLYRIARNEVLDQIARHKREVELGTKHIAGQTSPSAEETFFFEEAIRLEMDVVAKFPKQRQEVYLLRKNEGLSYDEIAARLGISKNTVKTHLRLALTEMRAKFSPYNDLYFAFVATMLLQY